MLESKNSLREDEPLKLNSFKIESKLEYNSSIQTNSNLINNESLFDLDEQIIHENSVRKEDSKEEVAKGNKDISNKNIVRLKPYFNFRNFPLIIVGPNSNFLSFYI